MSKDFIDLKAIIRAELPYIGIKPYSHNIISLTLGQILKEYGKESYNSVIKDLDLEKKGWDKI